MKVLMLGGTRFFGKHTVAKLLAGGACVTIATRGITPDPFGDRIERLCVERTDRDGLARALRGRDFDIVYDTLAYSSEDIRRLLDAITPKRYIPVSTVSVYAPLQMNTKEEDFDAGTYPLCWLSRGDASYAETKRQAEAALCQAYAGVEFALPRFPFVIGADDYTRRLHFYVEHAARGIPMFVDNREEPMSFLFAEDAADFLVWLGTSKLTGAVNVANAGTVSIGEMLRHIEEKTGKKALFAKDADAAPYNGTPGHSIHTGRAKRAGYAFSPLRDKLWGLLEELYENSI